MSMDGREFDRLVLVIEETVKRYTIPAAIEAAREEVSEQMIRSVVREELRNLVICRLGEAGS